MFDRYEKFKINGDVRIVPYVSIPVKNSDIYIVYEKGKMRMDTISYKYYKNSDYGWLILQANPQYGSMEFLIPDKVELRIPYPLSETLGDYEKQIEAYFRHNSFN
jgi:hypothetical protein